MGCSPIKVARELGSERRETVRSLSVVGVEICVAPTLVREDRVGPVYRLCRQAHRRVAASGTDKC